MARPVLTKSAVRSRKEDTRRDAADVKIDVVTLLQALRDVETDMYYQYTSDHFPSLCKESRRLRAILEDCDIDPDCDAHYVEAFGRGLLYASEVAAPKGAKKDHTSWKHAARKGRLEHAHAKRVAARRHTLKCIEQYW